MWKERKFNYWKHIYTSSNTCRPASYTNSIFTFWLCSNRVKCNVCIVYAHLFKLVSNFSYRKFPSTFSVYACCMPYFFEQVAKNGKTKNTKWKWIGFFGKSNKSHSNHFLYTLKVKPCTSYMLFNFNSTMLNLFYEIFFRENNEKKVE